MLVTIAPAVEDDCLACRGAGRGGPAEQTNQRATHGEPIRVRGLSCLVAPNSTISQPHTTTAAGGPLVWNVMVVGKSNDSWRYQEAVLK